MEGWRTGKINKGTAVLTELDTNLLSRDGGKKSTAEKINVTIITACIILSTENALRGQSKKKQQEQVLLALTGGNKTAQH